MPELVTNGMVMLMTSRRLPPAAAPRKGLTASQIAWCAANLKGFAWPRVSRLADHERASAAYRIAGLIEEARGTRETV